MHHAKRVCLTSRSTATTLHPAYRDIWQAELMGSWHLFELVNGHIGAVFS